MAFTFTRVDDRAIHGQTVTSWGKIYANEGIVLVDDVIAGDQIMRQIYKNAAIGMNVYIYNFNDAVVKASQAANSNKSYLLITRSPITMAELHKAGIDVGGQICIGPIPQNENRKAVAPFTSLSKDEIDACIYLTSQNIKIFFQNIPTTKITTWDMIKDTL